MGGGDHVSVGVMVQGSKSPRFHHVSVGAMVQGSKSPRFQNITILRAPRIQRPMARAYQGPASQESKVKGSKSLKGPRVTKSRVQGSKSPRFHHVSVGAMVQGSKSPRFQNITILRAPRIQRPMARAYQGPASQESKVKGSKSLKGPRVQGSRGSRVQGSKGPTGPRVPRVTKSRVSRV